MTGFHFCKFVNIVHLSCDMADFQTTWETANVSDGLVVDWLICIEQHVCIFSF